MYVVVTYSTSHSFRFRSQRKNMVSALLRSAVRTATKRRSPNTLHLHYPRNLSISHVRREEHPPRQEPVEDRRKTGFDYHTVEDLHGMTAAEILSGPNEDPKMRHFTGRHRIFFILLLFGTDVCFIVNFG